MIQVDESATIILGKSLGNIPLGININALDNLCYVRTFDTWDNSKEISKLYKYNSINIWTCNDIIEQLSANFGYVGKIFDSIGIHSSLKELSMFGQPYVDEEENIVLRGINGVTFDTEPWIGFDLEDNYCAKIVEILIFQESE